MSEHPVVLVIRDERYGSAMMRGMQQAQTLQEIGVPVRLLSIRSDRKAVMALRDSTVVLIKDAAHEDAAVLSLATAGNRIVWDVVDFLAHKPPLGGPMSPAEFVSTLMVSACVDQALVMTESAGVILRDAIPNVQTVSLVNHQVDRSLRSLPDAAPPTEFGVAYLGAEENVPSWVPPLPELSMLLTSDHPFPELIPAAQTVPFHVDFRNPIRDRRELKPWTKVATALHLGAAVIAEATEANLAALGADYPLLFDGGRVDFLRAVADARNIWEQGAWVELRSSLQGAVTASHPEQVARTFAEAIGAAVPAQ